MTVVDRFMEDLLLEEFGKACKDNTEIYNIVKSMETNRKDDISKGTGFYRIHHDLNVDDRLFLYSTRLIIPKPMIQDILTSSMVHTRVGIHSCSRFYKFDFKTCTNFQNLL